MSIEAEIRDAQVRHHLLPNVGWIPVNVGADCLWGGKWFERLRLAMRLIISHL